MGQQARHHFWALALANRLRVLVMLRHVLVGDSCHGRVIRNQQNLYPKSLLLP